MRSDGAKLALLLARRSLQSNLFRQSPFKSLEQSSRWICSSSSRVCADSNLDKAGLSLYADIVNCLSRNDLGNETNLFVEEIVGELEREGRIKGEDLRGPARLVKSLIAAGRGENARAVFGLMKRGGCMPNEYLFKFLARGLRRLGDEEGAKEVERDYEDWDVRGVWEEGEAETLTV